MKPRGRQMMAWLLTAAVTLSGNSFTVLADELDVQVQQETSGNEEVFAVDETDTMQDEVVDAEDSAEISFDEETQDEIQIEDTEDSEPEEELQIEEFQDGSEDLNLGESDDVSAFSSGESENPEERYLPQDQQVFWNEGFKINNEYDANGENIYVKDIIIENIGEEADPEEIICGKTELDAGGWFIFAEAPGKVKITLSYTYNNTEKEHSFEVTVKGDRYIVEQQLPSSGKNMFKNSEQSFPFVLHHEWRHGDEDQGSEVLEEWKLEFSPNEDGVTYIKNLLDNVTIEDHTVIVNSGSESAQTDIYLKAVFDTEDGQKKEVPCNLTINIVEEYDVLYPESLDIAVGETLNLNDSESGIRVEHVKEGEAPYDRDDVTYEVEYNKDQWENSAEAGQFPILKRMTNEGTGLTIIAKDEAGNELCRRNYQFDIRDYPVWFEDLREGEYSTSFFDNENGELRLNTEELEKESEGKEITVSWEVGYRKEEQNGDLFTTQEIPKDLIFWSETADRNVLAINGDTLSKAYKWLEENKGGEFWFEVRAHIKINGAEACMAGAAIHTREAREDYWFPVDEVILCGEWTHVEPQYNGHLENKDNLDGTEIETEVTNVSVANAEDETDETSVCTIKNHDEYGWDIYAERPGKATVTITYKNINKEEKTYTYTLQVSTNKYILEPQWGLSESNMLKNSSMEIGFILRHQWMEEEDGDRRDETVDDWSLEFAPDEENQSYNTNVLKNVIIDNEEKKVTVESGDEKGGTDIFLKAVISSEDGEQEEVTSDSAWIEVCDEYDVLYPEKIENLQVGATLNLNESDLGLRVEHIKEGGQTEKREDITLKFDYDEEDWKNITQDEPYPVLQRATSGNTWLNISAVDEDEQEICHRYYEFEELNYNVYFEDLRDDDYSTYFYDDEDGELTLNTEDLDDDNTEISWEVGYRTEEPDDESDSFVSEDIPEEMIFWAATQEKNILEISGEKLSKAYAWLEKKAGEGHWFEVRAHITANDIEVCVAQAGVNTRETHVEYDFPGDEEILAAGGYHVDRKYSGWIENKDNPNGAEIWAEVTKVSVANTEEDEDHTPVCTIQNEFYDNENGWNIQAERIGTAVVTITYYDKVTEEQKEHSYNLYVTPDKYTLEPQLSVSGENMLPNDTREIEFVLRHEWQYSDEDGGSEEIQDWTLNFDPDPNNDNWKYDEKLLNDVKIKDGNTLVVESGEGIWGTDILLKATLSPENGSQDIAYCSLHIEVMEEYDVLYPDNIENVNVGKTLNLNDLGIRVERVTAGEEPVVREDVSFDFEYDTEQWENIASAEDKFPVLLRKTEDPLEIKIIVREPEGEETAYTYWLDEVESPVYFDTLRTDDYWTFVYKTETYEISANTENLKDVDASIKWKIVSREKGSEKSEEVSEDLKFWSFDDNKIVIDGKKLEEAQNALDNYGYKWYEVQACVVVGETELNSYAAFGLEKIKTETIDSLSYFPVQSNQQILMTDTLWVPEEYNCWVEDGEHPFGGFVQESITGIESTNNNAVLITKKEKGWVIKPLEKGKYTIRFSFTTLLGNEERELTFRFYDKTYWMEISFSDDNNQIVAGETKQVDVAVYYRTDSNSKTLVSPSEYTLSAESSNAKTISVNKQKSQISLTAGASEEPYTIEVRVDVTMNEKYENYDKAPVWYTEDNFGISVLPMYEDVLALTSYIDTIPEMGDIFDLNAYGPILKRYDSTKKKWEEIKENVRIHLEYDEECWTATKETDGDRIPVLIRSKKDYTVLRLVAEELVYNPKYGNEQWTEVAERYIGIQETVCAHEWKTTEEKAATCGEDGNRHKRCIICEKEKDEIIPATGKHSYGEWVTVKESTCLEEGEKTASCKVCGSVVEEAIEKGAHNYEWVTDKNATCSEAGSRHEECKVCHITGNKEVLKASGHILGEWKTIREATAVAEGIRERSCKVCGGAKETLSLPKLTATLTLNVPVNKNLPMKMKQTYQLKVSGLAADDKVVSWTSSNKKIATVSGSGKLKALKKTGKTTITVKLASAKTAKFTVKVQKADVTTTSLTVLNKATGKKMPKTVSLKAKKKLALTATVAPVTSKQKVTYSTSNKSIATVNAKGVITAKKKGTVTITIKSGKKKVTVKVKVTK